MLVEPATTCLSLIGYLTLDEMVERQGRRKRKEQAEVRKNLGYL
jgi:hypothetical protein